MPSLGADMDEGTLSEWLVHPGDQVTRGDVIAVVETAKSAIEVECFDSGTVEALLVDEGTTVPVGTPLAHIGTTAESRPAQSRPSERRRTESPPASTPLVRRLAQDRHVDLATVHGSGPGGRITRADVEHHEPEPAQAAEQGKTASPAESTRAATGRQSGTEPTRRKRSASGAEAKTAPTTRPTKPMRSDGSTGERPTPLRVKSSPLARRLATRLTIRNRHGRRGCGRAWLRSKDAALVLHPQRGPGEDRRSSARSGRRAYRGRGVHWHRRWR